MLGSYLNDLKHSLRTLLRSPVFTLTAVSALTIAIGANTAVFSVVNAVLLKPARFADPERTVWLATTMPTGRDYMSSDPKFTIWRQQTSVLEDVTSQAYAKVNLMASILPSKYRPRESTHPISGSSGCTLRTAGASLPRRMDPAAATWWC